MVQVPGFASVLVELRELGWCCGWARTWGSSSNLEFRHGLDDSKADQNGGTHPCIAALEGN